MTGPSAEQARLAERLASLHERSNALQVASGLLRARAPEAVDRSKATRRELSREHRSRA